MIFRLYTLVYFGCSTAEGKSFGGGSGGSTRHWLGFAWPSIQFIAAHFLPLSISSCCLTSQINKIGCVNGFTS